jgi:hypothetical protein
MATWDGLGFIRWAKQGLPNGCKGVLVLQSGLKRWVRAADRGCKIISQNGVSCCLDVSGLSFELIGANRDWPCAVMGLLHDHRLINSLGLG